MIVLKLVRLGLGLEREGDDVINIDADTWTEVFRQLKDQALLGVAFAGLERLKKECAPPKNLLLQWLGVAENIKRRNNVMDSAAVTLSESLHADGWRFCILKGQTVARMYPRPELRQSGDIDVWIFGRKDGERVTRRKIIQYLERNGRKVQICYLHADGIVMNGNVSVEVHFRPSFSVNPFMNARLQKEFQKLSESPDFPSAGVLKIPAATYEFNRLFMLHHVYRHLFSEGIGMRQVVDYAMLLMQRTSVRDVAFEKTLKRLGMLRFARGLMWILHNCLNVDEKHLYTLCDEREGRFIFGEILRSGNFGAASAAGSEKRSKWGRFEKKERRNVSFLTKYPSEVFWYVPFTVWETLRYKIPHI